MTIKGIDQNRLRAVSGISDAQRRRMCDFLQGTVYCWCKTCPSEWFAVRDLLPFYWTDSPLTDLLNKYDVSDENLKDAMDGAVLDAGWLLEAVLANEPHRLFESREASGTRQYRLTAEQPAVLLYDQPRTQDMTIKNFDKNQLRGVSGITDAQHQRMCDFLQGAVYCWCKNRPNEWFALRDLLPFYWNDSPLIDLFNKYYDSDEHLDYAIHQAAVDAGWLLKEVLANEPRRVFESSKAFKATQYRLIEEIEP